MKRITCILLLAAAFHQVLPVFAEDCKSFKEDDLRLKCYDAAYGQDAADNNRKADLETAGQQFCEKKENTIALMSGINDVPAVKGENLEVLDATNGKAESYDVASGKVVCTYDIKWSNSIEGKYRITLDKESLGQEIIRYENINNR